MITFFIMVFLGVSLGFFLVSPLVMVFSAVLAFVVWGVRNHFEQKRLKKEKEILEKNLEKKYKECIEKEAEIWYNAFRKLENGSRVEKIKG